MKKVVEPEWMKYMPGDACLNTKEIAVIYGYKNSTSIPLAIIRGIVPKYSHKSFSNTGRRAKLMWSVKYLRELWAR